MIIIARLGSVLFKRMTASVILAEFSYNPRDEHLASANSAREQYFGHCAKRRGGEFNSRA